MRYAFRRLIVSLVFLLFFPAAALSDTLSAGQITAVQQIQNKLVVIKDLAEHELISQTQAEKANAFYLSEAAQVTGRDVTAQQIDTLTSAATKAEGFGVFLNTVIIIAGVFLVLSGIGLISYYLRDLLRSLPSSFYECAAYFVTAQLLAAGYFFRPFQIWFLTIDPLWLSIPGAFAFAGCVYLTYWLHWLRPKAKARQTVDNYVRPMLAYFGPGLITFPVTLFGLCTLVWGATAIFYHQIFPAAGIPHFIAFIAVMALQSFLGFSVITTPGCIFLGWDKNAQVPKSTVSSLALLLAYVWPFIAGQALPEYLKLFQTGCLFMGAFVFYLGLLVMSNKWYCQYAAKAPRAVITDSTTRYWMMQLLTIVFGVAAFYVGNSFHLGSLLGIGGTFFTIYLLEKYYEIPWKGVGWAWSLLGVAVALYFFVGFAGQHPQFFVWGIR